VGYYPFVCSLKEYKEFQDDPKKLDDLFKRLLCERMSKWLSLVTEKIDLKNKYVICMPGNDDELFIDDVIKSFESDGIIYPLGKVLNLFYDFEIISLEYVNPTPWKTPRECEEQELKEKIEKLLEKCKDPGKTIFNFHCPPFNTRLDLARKLSKDLKPSAHGEREHVGSKAVREAIEKYQPTLGLHGHIHESFAFDHIGKTLVVNPGSEYTEGILRGFVIDVTTNRIDKFVKVEG
jgi:Icc-related predicted phosphoesterase